MRITAIVSALVGVAATSAASAAVVGQPLTTGFQVQEEATIAAPADRVWAALLKPGGWWNPEHTYSHDADNMSIEPRAGGCWCEKWAGGSVEHMRVVYAAPPRALRLRGGLGPLQQMGIEGAMTWTLQPSIDGKSTLVTVVYAVGGYSPTGDFVRLAGAVDGVLAEQVGRLQLFMQTGRPTATATQ